MSAKRATTLVAALLWMQCSWAAEPLRLAASSSWAMPYGKFESDRLTGGIVYDLAQALGKALDMPVSIIVLPRKRIDAAVLSGDVDLRCYINPQWTAIPEQHVWSNNLFDITEVIFGAAGVPEPANLRSLAKGAAISTVLGYEYQALNPVFARGELKRDDAVDVEKVLFKLTAGRTPYGVSDAMALHWYLRTTPQHQLSKWRLVLSRSDFQCGVPKKGRIPAARILSALDDLKKSGKIDEILHNYR